MLRTVPFSIKCHALIWINFIATIMFCVMTMKKTWLEAVILNENWCTKICLTIDQRY